MFFIIGITSKRDKLDFNQNMICSNCGRYGRYEIIMDYTCFSLFFIPILKWNKTYYVRNSCCGSIYSIKNNIGDKIARGKNINLEECHLQLVQKGRTYSVKRCTNCGFEMDNDFQYCPKCGTGIQ